MSKVVSIFRFLFFSPYRQDNGEYNYTGILNELINYIYIPMSANIMLTPKACFFRIRKKEKSFTWRSPVVMGGWELKSSKRDSFLATRGPMGTVAGGPPGRRTTKACAEFGTYRMEWSVWQLFGIQCFSSIPLSGQQG